MNPGRKRWLGWLIAALVMIGLIGSIALYRPFHSGAGPVSAAGLPPRDLNTLPGNLQTFLVMGVDNSDSEFGRSDSMVVVSYDPKVQRLAMLSIPRDTWTLIPGHGYDKINHAYAYGGHALAIDTVERLLGIDINHWVTLSFDGFVKVIDAMGGVELNPTERLYYEDPYDERMGTDGLVINIRPGPQVMDGITALKYSRFRADAEGDLGRMRRQQEVIKAVLKKASTPAMIGRAAQLIPALYSTIGTDLTVGEMVKLAAGGREALANPLVTGSIGGDPYTIDNIFYFGSDLVTARTAAYELLVGEPPDQEFLRKARQENDRYQAALAEAVARSEAAAKPVEPETEEGEGGAQPDPVDPGADDGESPDGSKADPPDPTKPNPTKPDPTKPTPDQPDDSASSGEAITVALVDATGQGIGREYVDQVRALGFRVARVSRSSKVLTNTLVIDHASQPQVEARLRQLFPRLVYTSDPDPKAEQAIEIILGTDLLPRS